MPPLELEIDTMMDLSRACSQVLIPVVCHTAATPVSEFRLPIQLNLVGSVKAALEDLPYKSGSAGAPLLTAPQAVPSLGATS